MACIDPIIDALLNEMEPSGTVLLDWLKPRVDDTMLQYIADADYGYLASEHYSALVKIRDKQEIPTPLRGVPREVLELERWSEPDAPVAKPKNRRLQHLPDRIAQPRGHLSRAFACAVLLKAGDDVETQDYISAENCTLIQLVASSLWLGSEATQNTLRFLCWRVLRMDREAEEYAFFAMAILLLRVKTFTPGQDAKALNLIANGVIAEETHARNGEMYLHDTDEWLLGLTGFNARHEVWRNLTRELLLEPAKDIPEDAASTLRDIATRLAGKKRPPILSSPV